MKPGVRNVERRSYIYLRGRAPDDLPPPGLPLTPPAGRFDPSTAPAAVELEPVADWSAEQVHEALSPFLAGRSTWPNFSEFQRAGLGRLYWHVERHGGPRHWARLVGLPWQPSHADRDAWPETRIRAELTEYLKDKTVWPTWSQFKHDGQVELRDALKWAGGPSRWAEELGIELPGFRREQAGRWTYGWMRDELATFTQGRDAWPPRAEFMATGRGGLYDAIRKAGVREHLAAELGLYLPPGRKYIRTHWTEPLIRATLDEFLEGRTMWPSRNEFKAAGLNSLRDTLRRTGTLHTWAARYGIPVRPRGGPTGPTTQVERPRPERP